MSKYKVCILAAGVGSRMGPLTHNINKAILPINFKAVISLIIEKIDKDIDSGFVHVSISPHHRYAFHWSIGQCLLEPTIHPVNLIQNP